MRTFCTLFDLKYAVQGCLLLDSLRAFEKDADIWVLAMDDKTGPLVFAKYESVHVLTEKDMLDRFPELVPVKATRSRAEWCFTLSSHLMKLVQEKTGVPCAYMDADTFLYQALDPLYEELGTNPIGIIPHRFAPEHYERLKINGTFNVGWVYIDSFSDKGGACLDAWMAVCREGKTREQSGRFSDQLALENWPADFGAKVIEHPGANLAPWNQSQYKYDVEPNRLLVDGKPLLFYHFHELKVTPVAGKKSLSIYPTGYQLALAVVENVYMPYMSMAVAKALQLPDTWWNQPG